MDVGSLDQGVKVFLEEAVEDGNNIFPAGSRARVLKDDEGQPWLDICRKDGGPDIPVRCRPDLKVRPLNGS